MDADHASHALATPAEDTGTPAESRPRVHSLGGVPRVRARHARARTISIKRLSKKDIARGRWLYPVEEHARYERPVSRGDCLPGGCNEQRPCPWVSCAYHLALDVNPRTGSIKENFPGLEVWEMAQTCTLDVADEEGITLEEVGEVANLSRERVRQLETKIVRKLRADERLVGHLDADAAEPRPRVHLRLLDEPVTMAEESWSAAGAGALRGGVL